MWSLAKYNTSDQTILVKFFNLQKEKFKDFFQKFLPKLKCSTLFCCSDFRKVRLIAIFFAYWSPKINSTIVHSNTKKYSHKFSSTSENGYCLILRICIVTQHRLWGRAQVKSQLLSASPRDRRILFARIHFTWAPKNPGKVRTY